MTGCSRRQADIGIVAHTTRFSGLSLVADVAASVLNVDDGSLGCDGNHRLTWTDLASTERPWGVVLEDDALPVADFLDQLDAMLTVAPAPIIGLYLGRSRPPAWQSWVRQQTINADRTGDCFIPGKQRLLHAVGVAICADLIPDMLNRLSYYLPIDEGISAWAKAAGHRTAYCWPSLVDHDDGPTLVCHRDGKPRDEPRVAWWCSRREEWHGDVRGALW